MVGESSTDDQSSTKKGVNVHSSSLSPQVHQHSIPDSSSSSRSIKDIRNELQTVLDLMGPSTPYMSSRASERPGSEADNEESVMSMAKPRRKKSLSFVNRGSGSSSPNSSSRNISSLIELSTTDEEKEFDDSVAVNDGSDKQLENFEFSCCEHGNKKKPECVQSSSEKSGVVVTPSRAVAVRSTKTVAKKPSLIHWIKSKSYDLMLKRSFSKPCELYRINMSGNDECNAPKRVIFDLIDGIPKPSCSTVATNTIRNPVEKYKSRYASTEKEKQNCNCNEFENLNVSQSPRKNRKKGFYYDSDGNTRVDYYYFDHGNAQFFHTTDTPPVMATEIIAAKTERFTTRFWAEFFATIHVFVSFCVSFILQLFKFLLYSVLRPLMVGIVQMSSDYLLKPFLTMLFNGVIQPILIFFYNIGTSLRDLVDPIAEGMGYFCREVAVVFRAIRFCTYKRNADDGKCGCEKKYTCEC